MCIRDSLSSLQLVIEEGAFIRDNAEPFEDTDGNGVYSPAEQFTDLNDNGIWDGAEEFKDFNFFISNIHFLANQTLLLSTVEIPQGSIFENQFKSGLINKESFLPPVQYCGKQGQPRVRERDIEFGPALANNGRIVLKIAERLLLTKMFDIQNTISEISIISQCRVLFLLQPHDRHCIKTRFI